MSEEPTTLESRRPGPPLDEGSTPLATPDPQPTGTLAGRVRLGMRRSANWLQLIRFGLVGASGYVINLVVFALLTQALDAHHVVGGIGAFLVAVTNNFTLNRRWTFRIAAAYRGQAARFLAVSLVGLGLNLALLELLVTGVGAPELLSQAIAVAFVMPINFVGNKLWTFAPERSS